MLDQPARRTLNMTYTKAVEGMSKEDREEFDLSLTRTMDDWDDWKQELRKAEMDLVSQVGEIG